jgi:uncharacterized membrane protein YkvA (DUF1232 family)
VPHGFLLSQPTLTETESAPAHGYGGAMPWWAYGIITVAIFAALWGTLVLALYATGRGEDAKELARFVPDCLVLVRRLLHDPRVARRHKALLLGLIAYLAFPFDLVPDFIPIVGQLDDALIVAWVLRRLVRGAGPEVVAQHWPGAQRPLRLVLRFAGDRSPR